MNKLFKNNSEVNKFSPVKLSSQHLLAIEGMQKTEIQKLLDRADYFANLDKHADTIYLSGYVVLNVFLKIQLVLGFHLNLQQEDLEQK